MPKPTTKDELIEQIQGERRRLEKNLARLSDDEKIQPRVVGNWSVKDILSRLMAWEQLFLGWYAAGLRGDVPETPPSDLDQEQLEKLNRQFFRKYSHYSLPVIQTAYQESYKKILAAIQTMDDTQLFTPGHFAWTGDKLLVDFVTTNTSKHYQWAKTQLRQWMKEQGKL
jgi:hypothetical protein